MGTLTGIYRLPTGEPETGTIRFTLTARSPDSTPDSHIIVEGPVAVQLDALGAFTIDLNPTDDEGITYAGDLAYHVQEWVSSGRREYWIRLEGDGPWDIAQLAFYDAPPYVAVMPVPGPVGPEGPVGPVGPEGPEGVRGPAGPSGGVNAYAWNWGGTSVGDPGTGRLAVNGTGNAPRVLSISKTDADGFDRDLLLLLPGDTITVTDYPDPVVTGWARYALTGDPVDQGTWVRLDAIRTDASGTPTPPPVDTRLRVIASLASGGDLYPLRTDIWAAGAETLSPLVSVDPALGKVTVAEVETGNTGWRDVSADLLNGWTGQLWIRRVGDTVHVLAGNTALNATAATSGNFYDLPSPGWRVAANSYVSFTLQHSTEATVYSGRIASTFALTVQASAADYNTWTSARLSWQFLTNEPWPTTLPGTQVTPPAGQATILPIPEDPPT